VCAIGRLSVNPTPRLHVVKHDGVCGDHVPSPHPACQAKTAPYNAAELVTLALRTRVAVFRCHGCGATWQASA
jgi:hypothetical protein